MRSGFFVLLFIVNDVEEATSGVFVASGSNSMLLKTHVGLDLYPRNCRGQVSHAHQVEDRAGEGKLPVHFAHPSMAKLAHERNRLQPAKAFFNPLSLSLTEGISRVPRGAAINRTATPPCMILRDVGRYPQIPALAHEVMCVEPLCRLPP